MSSARSETTLSALVAALQGNCGDIYDACRQSRVSPLFVSKWRKDDAKVNEELAEAERVGAQSLESEAIRRAKFGVEKAVWYKGEEVGTETVYSDGLMQTILKARLPERYGGGAAEGGTTNNYISGNVNIMPRANSYQDWLAMRDLQALSPADRKALPAPEEAEFTPVDTHDDIFGTLQPVELHDDIF